MRGRKGSFAIGLGDLLLRFEIMEESLDEFDLVLDFLLLRLRLLALLLSLVAFSIVIAV